MSSKDEFFEKVKNDLKKKQLMRNTITLRFDKEELKRRCKVCTKKDKYCNQTDEQLIDCNLIWGSSYKIIKEQNR